MNVNITAAAREQIIKICQKTPSKYVRLSILSGGCNGFTKNWDVTDYIDTNDTEFNFESGSLVIDEISLEFLKNSTIDYTSTLLGSYFNISIPEATSECGCGTSFSV